MDNLDFTKNQISFEEYLVFVIAESRILGYIHSQAYYYEIQEYYHEGYSVKWCVDSVFNN